MAADDIGDIKKQSTLCFVLEPRLSSKTVFFRDASDREWLTGESGA